MSSEAIVYVVYETARKPVELAAVRESVRQQEPHILIEGSGAGFFAGLYDTAPLKVYQNLHHADVLTESQGMADSLAQTNSPENIVAQVRLCDARFEIVWNLRRDPDLVPETGDLVFDIAKLITGLTEGVIVIEGSRLYDPSQEWGYNQLFPE